MAETLTYDPGADTVTTESTLTPEQQESLQVGEELASQQDQLLAGKYENAKELEKAYMELEKKLGESQEDSSTETQEQQLVGEYQDDGSVNYDTVNETYGEQIGTVLKNADVDPWAINKHFHENNGTITSEMNQSLIDAGFSQEAVNSYLQGVASSEGYSSQTADLSDSEISSIKNIVGTDKEYDNLINWAGDNLPQEQIDSFDSIINTGNVNSIKLAVTGLKAEYESANGYEGRMLSGKPPRKSSDVFRSQAELVRAMSDPRYDSDPAYRLDVMDKLERSDMQF